MQTVMQNLVFGLFVGSIYGICALGLALVFGVLRLLNVAHGEFVMIGAYACYWVFVGIGIDPFVSILVVLPLMFVLGLVFNTLLFDHLTRLETEIKIRNSLLMSFGLGLVLQNAATLVWTGNERSVQTTYAGQGFLVAGVALPYTRLATFALALIAIFVLWFLLQRTRWGKAIRATAEDWEAATQAGINVRRMYMVTFGLGAACAGIAGVLLAVTFGFMPTIGFEWTLKALIVVVLAGTGSIFGAFPAGLFLGLAEAISGLTIGADYRQVVGLVLFLVVLLVRPQGLFGKAE